MAGQVTQFLYHGGNADNLDRILRFGLQPRSKSGAKDNWKHTVSSNRMAVYLTTTYAFHFAGQFERGLIVEIDRAKLKPTMLYPDEDVLEQASRDLTAEQWPYVPPSRVKSMQQRTRYFRKMAVTLPGYTELSLEMMGTVAYYTTIPPEAFRRVFVIDWEKVPAIIKMDALDTIVSVLNYKFLAEQKRALTRYFTLDPVTSFELDFGLRIAGAVQDSLKEVKDDRMDVLVTGLVERHRCLSEALADRSAITCIRGD